MAATSHQRRTDPLLSNSSTLKMLTVTLEQCKLDSSAVLCYDVLAADRASAASVRPQLNIWALQRLDRQRPRREQSQSRATRPLALQGVFALPGACRKE